MGTSCEGNSYMQGLANKHTVGYMCSLVNSTNELFVSVSEDLPRLQASHYIVGVSDLLPAQYTISVNVTEAALANVKINKSTGPDKMPPWIVKDVAQQLHGWTGQVNIQQLSPRRCATKVVENSYSYAIAQETTTRVDRKCH